MLVTNLVVEPLPCSSQFTTSKEKKRISIRITSNASFQYFICFLNPTFRVGPTLPSFSPHPPISSHFSSPYKYSPKPLPRGLNLSLTKISSPQLSLSLELSKTFMESNHNKNTETIKFLCSYGGKILPRYTDGTLRYAGGLTRVLAVDRSISFTGLFDFPFPDSIFLWTCLVFFLWISKSIYVCCYRVDGEARRVLWLIGESPVSIADRRLGNPNFYHVRRGLGECYRRVRSRFVVVDEQPSFEDQSGAFAAEISQTNLSSSNSPRIVAKLSFLPIRSPDSLAAGRLLRRRSELLPENLPV